MEKITDPDSIDLSNDYELRYWTGQLKVTNDELRQGVEQFGNRIEAVKPFLDKA